MRSSSIEDLNKKYSVSGYLSFKEGPGGLIYAAIRNENASAQIFLHGAHLTSFVPQAQEPVIFLSPKSGYEQGKAIRGGIPISWPWFADHPTESSKPAHGFARTSVWEVRGTELISEAETAITLGFSQNEHTLELWDYSFDLEVLIRIGKALNLELTTTNIGNKHLSLTSAFHSYYSVGDIDNITVRGLEDTGYIDKVYNFTNKIQSGPVTITQETDRIYLDTQRECVIVDPVLERKIRINKSGSSSTVVWNPWAQKARAMNDLGDNDFTKFVCVESANVGTDIIRLAPQEKHTLSLNVAVERL